jgi:hypothetical protein
MMKKTMKMALVLPLMLSLSAGNMYAHGKHNGFIAGACAVGAGLFAAAGAVAFADWCCSETNEQFLTRIRRETDAIISEYKQTMDYFAGRAGIDIYSYSRIQDIPEAVLFEFSTYIWNRNISYYDYLSKLQTSQHTLESNLREFRKRFSSFDCHMIDCHSLLNYQKSMETLLAEVKLFAKSLECHQSYLHLYETVGETHSKYTDLIDIVTSGRYTVSGEVKQYVLSSSNARYPFTAFVKDIERDISNVQSCIRALAYNYESGRNSARILANRLMTIKDIIVSDPRYQEEKYYREQARLERQRRETLEAQARLERDKIRLIREQNRILEERNRIEQYKNCWPLYGQEIVVEINL